MVDEPHLDRYALDAEAARPLYLQLRDRIIADIRRGTFTVGSAIPSISALEAGCNASRVTVVRALARLVEDGFIFPQAGKGYYVATRGSKSLLAVVAPFDLRTMHYSGQLLAGVEMAAGAAGYDVMEVDGGLSVEEFRTAVRRVQYERGARSLILLPPEDLTADALDGMPAERVVIADRNLPRLARPMLLQDRQAAYRLLADHLAGVGVRRAALLGFSLPEAEAQFAAALAEVGLEPVDADLTGREPVERLADLCDAVCCADDSPAVKLFLRLAGASRRLPFALTGFNHTAHGRLVPGGLTTIDPGLVQMGMLAVSMLGRPLTDATTTVHVSPRLVVGATTREYARK